MYVKPVMEIILASSSPSRRKLLESLGIHFKIIVPQVDEESYQKSIDDPYLLCKKLARLKVESIQKKDAWIIGADQMTLCNGVVIGKSKNYKNAFKILSMLQDRKHKLIGALCIRRPDGSFFEDLTISQMTMRPLSSRQIHRYLEKEQPYECAGSYKVESLGISLFEKIETSDFTSIIGLPMMTVCSQLVSEII